MKTLTKTTHVAKVKQANTTQIYKVCALIDWTDEQYCNYQFEQYTAFVKRLFLGYPPELYKNALYSPLMRGFWNNEAYRRNQTDFLPFATLELEDCFDSVDENGNLCVIVGLPPGDDYLVDEFMFIHNHTRLINDDDFMHQYYQTIKLITHV